MAKEIFVKRIYDEFSNTDGQRILVDRLWPRGIKKDRINISFWLKDIAPSTELRKWFAHDPLKWKEFQEKYYNELDEKKDLCKQIVQSGDKITLLYSAKNEKYNNAVVLKKYLKEKFL